MKKIKRVGRLQPRDSLSFYKEHPALYRKLIGGETVEVPDAVFPTLTGVKETRDTLKSFLKSSSKSEKKKKSYQSKTQTQIYIEANDIEIQRQREAKEKLSEEKHTPSSDDIVIRHNDEIKTEDTTKS